MTSLMTYCSGICMEWLRETTKTQSQISRCTGLGSSNALFPYTNNQRHRLIQLDPALFSRRVNKTAESDYQRR
jgi:hypothetical protein